MKYKRKSRPGTPTFDLLQKWFYCKSKVIHLYFIWWVECKSK